jgi:hypothetical protein
VHRERDARVVHRSIAERNADPRSGIIVGGHGLRHDLGVHVGYWHGVGGHDSFGLPHEHRRRGVDHGVIVEHRTDALVSGFVAQLV